MRNLCVCVIFFVRNIYRKESCYSSWIFTQYSSGSWTDPTELVLLSVVHTLCSKSDSNSYRVGTLPKIPLSSSNTFCIALKKIGTICAARQLGKYKRQWCSFFFNSGSRSGKPRREKYAPGRSQYRRCASKTSFNTGNVTVEKQAFFCLLLRPLIVFSHCVGIDLCVSRYLIRSFHHSWASRSHRQVALSEEERILSIEWWRAMGWEPNRKQYLMPQSMSDR